MATRSRGINATFARLQAQAQQAAAVYAATYAKEGMKDMAEAWAQEFLDFVLTGQVTPDITGDLGNGIKAGRGTKWKRHKRGNPPEPPLAETRELLSYIEFRWTCLPDENYDILEVGIYNDEKLIGHSDSITPYRLAMVHEYGFEGSFMSNKGARYVKIPARPIFKPVSERVGFDRVLHDVANKVTLAAGRERRSVKYMGQESTMYGSAVMGHQRRHEKAWGGTKPPGMVKRTQIGRFDAQLNFYWENNDVELEYQKGISKLNS